MERSSHYRRRDHRGPGSMDKVYLTQEIGGKKMEDLRVEENSYPLHDISVDSRLGGV